MRPHRYGLRAIDLGLQINAGPKSVASFVLQPEAAWKVERIAYAFPELLWSFLSEVLFLGTRLYHRGL